MSSARRTSPLARILRSAAFRLTLIYAGLFVVSAAVLFATVFVDDDADRGRQALAEYAKATYRMPLEQVGRIQVFITGSMAEVEAQLARYVDAGAAHVLLRIAAVDPATFASHFARVGTLRSGVSPGR